MSPTPDQLARLAYDMDLADRTERVAAENVLAAMTAALDYSDHLFVELLRLRREQARTKWWQVTRRRRLDAQISVIRFAQKALVS